MSDKQSGIALYGNLVEYLAGKLAGRGCSQEKLVETGLIGLSGALDGYHPGHGTNFSVFATPVILSHMLRHLGDLPEPGAT